MTAITGAYVRVTNSGDHHVQCDTHGVISWHIRSYSLALAAARAHNCQLTTDELERIDDGRRQEWRAEDKEWRQ